MKKLAIFLMVLSAGMFTLGCQPTGTKPKEEKKPAAEKPEGEKTPAEPVAPK